MTVSPRFARLFGAAVAVFCIGSAAMLESQTAQLERRCIESGTTVTECKLTLRGR